MTNIAIFQTSQNNGWAVPVLNPSEEMRTKTAALVGHRTLKPYTRIEIAQPAGQAKPHLYLCRPNEAVPRQLTYDAAKKTDQELARLMETFSEPTIHQPIPAPERTTNSSQAPSEAISMMKEFRGMTQDLLKAEECRTNQMTALMEKILAKQPAGIDPILQTSTKPVSKHAAPRDLSYRRRARNQNYRPFRNHYFTASSGTPSVQDSQDDDEEEESSV